jgi:hypothetical protein
LSKDWQGKFLLQDSQAHPAQSTRAEQNVA